jgi:hypothetical protein
MFKDIFARSGILAFSSDPPIRKPVGELGEMVLEARQRKLDALRVDLATKKNDLAKASKAAEIFDAETISRGRRLQLVADKARAEYHRACDAMHAEQLSRESLRGPLAARISQLKDGIRRIEFGDPLAAVYDWSVPPGTEPSKPAGSLNYADVAFTFPPAPRFGM